MIEEEHVTVIRVHPFAGGYAVVNADRDRAPRAVFPIDQAFPTVVAAMRWAVRERPGHQIDVAQECESEEVLFRAEALQYAAMLNAARSWFVTHVHQLPPVIARDLGDSLFPERFDELARWLTEDRPATGPGE